MGPNSGLYIHFQMMPTATGASTTGRKYTVRKKTMPRTPRQSSTPKNKPMATGVTVPSTIQIKLLLSALQSRGSAIEPLIIQEADKLFDRLGAIPFGKTEVDGVKKTGRRRK